MIYIDFQGGCHGNYLEFVCNKFLANVEVSSPSPFNAHGASHKKMYVGVKQFHSWHYFEYNNRKTNLVNSKIISIRISQDDLLPVTAISLLRAGDYGLDNNQLEIDTYNKLDNIHYRWMLDNIKLSYFQDNRISGYQVIKDPSWPEVTTIEQFENLPLTIREECVNMHNLRYLEFSKDCPDCPRHILREFFKIGFKYPEQQGFMTQQQKMTYDGSNDVLMFPVSSFYNTDKFIEQLRCIADWTGYNFEPSQDLVDLHLEFLSKQPYKNSKHTCDKLIAEIISQTATSLPNLTLLEESYIESQLELHYNKEFPFGNDKWFSIQDLYNELKL